MAASPPSVNTTSSASPQSRTPGSTSLGTPAATTQAQPTPSPTFAIRELSQAQRDTMTGTSWHAGCPVALSDLRRVDVAYTDPQGEPHQGALIAHKDVAESLSEIMTAIHEAKFPIHSIEPVSSFDGNDDASMAANNTSAFNCRKVLGTNKWSKHSYGKAIDINPLMNPWVRRNGNVYPPEGAKYRDRTLEAPGLITPDSPVAQAFLAAGWRWGASFSSGPDYQHFDQR